MDHFSQVFAITPLSNIEAWGPGRFAGNPECEKEFRLIFPNHANHANSIKYTLLYYYRIVRVKKVGYASDPSLLSLDKYSMHA